MNISAHFNPFQPSVAFHIKTNHLIFNANQMTGFFMKWNTGLKWDNDIFLLKVNWIRSSCAEVFCNKVVLRNFTKFTGKHLCQSLFFNKVAGLGPATLLKKGLWHRYFLVNFVKLLRTPFYVEHLWWLLLLNDVSNILICEKVSHLSHNSFRHVYFRNLY